ncbi:MAG TPA: hypothetical protein VJT68_00500, partial [Thermoleophilaceae bacterium]|nr:hypothetical protein [Thermoleophilaceae bacterium]
MDFVVATILYPLVVAALALGAGLLVDVASARALPGVFIPVAGLAALMVVAELFAYWEPIAPAAPFAVAVVAVAGYAVGWTRLRGVRLDPWPIAATVGAYVLVCLPVLLSGRVTETGYLLDTTAALHVTAADYLTEHARNFGRLPVSALSLTMEGYYGNGYPSGGHTLLGATGRLIGTPRLWLYQPFISLLVAFCVPSLFYMLRSATLSRAFAAAAAVIAAVPALVYAYAQMGAIKELAALPFILALGPLLIMLPRLLALGLRGAVPIAVVAAAGIGAIGVAFGPWLVVVAVAGLVLVVVRSDRDTWRRRDIRSLRPLVAFAAVLAVATLVLAVPTFGPLSESVSVAKSLSTSNAAAAADPGNLLRPLLGSQ